MSFFTTIIALSFLLRRLTHREGVQVHWGVGGRGRKGGAGGEGRNVGRRGVAAVALAMIAVTVVVISASRRVVVGAVRAEHVGELVVFAKEVRRAKVW